MAGCYHDDYGRYKLQQYIVRCEKCIGMGVRGIDTGVRVPTPVDIGCWFGFTVCLLLCPVVTMIDDTHYKYYVLWVLPTIVSVQY